MRKYLYFILVLSFSLWMSVGCGKHQDDTQDPNNTQSYTSLPFYGTWYTTYSCIPISFSSGTGTFGKTPFQYQVSSSNTAFNSQQGNTFQIKIQSGSFSEDWTLTVQWNQSLSITTTSGQNYFLTKQCGFVY